MVNREKYHKLTDEQKIEIGERFYFSEEELNYSTLGRMYGISHTQARRHVLNYKEKYLEEAQQN